MKSLMVPVVIAGEKRIEEDYIYQLHELPLLEILLTCKTSKKRDTTYIEIPAAFDIETTTIFKKKPDGRIDSDQRPFAFMYHWQLCIGTYVIFGRRWEEFLEALRYISDGLHLSATGTRMVIWVHNLAFEFGFIRRFLSVTDGFYRAPYKPLRFVTGDGFEFRDSLALSNMNLESFCKSSPGCRHWKLKDDLDYTKIRTANSYMTDLELAYCYNDVRGLCECIAARMKDDTLASMPMTSTGYVRRDTRNSMRKNKQNRRLFQGCALDAKMYKIMRSAFRGGNTHANAAHAREIINGPVYSYDITSSYPAVMMEETYPIGAFELYETERFLADKTHDKYCYIIQLMGENVRYKGRSGIPYISISKCEKYADGEDFVEDNGRIRSTSGCWMWATDIDYQIITDTYDGEWTVGTVYAATRGKLPQELRDVVMEYFRRKTELKGLEDKDSQYLYSRYKALLNAIFGMCCTRLDMEHIIYEPSTDPEKLEFKTDDTPLDDILEKYYKSRNNFLSYQWGVWITAHARARLQKMLETVGEDVIYCDTDSIKFIHDHDKDFAAENTRLKAIAESCGAYADNRAGKRYYLGTWDKEHTMDRFVTLGAKKYLYEIDGEMFSTIAGVNKARGSEYFQKHGMEAFRIGTVIPDSGHLVAYRNDDDVHEITIDGCTMTTASNIALVDDTYEIGVTGSYMDLLDAVLDGIEYGGSRE